MTTVTCLVCFVWTASMQILFSWGWGLRVHHCTLGALHEASRVRSHKGIE